MGDHKSSDDDTFSWLRQVVKHQDLLTAPDGDMLFTSTEENLDGIGDVSREILSRDHAWITLGAPRVTTKWPIVIIKLSQRRLMLRPDMWKVDIIEARKHLDRNASLVVFHDREDNLALETISYLSLVSGLAVRALVNVNEQMIILQTHNI